MAAKNSPAIERMDMDRLIWHTPGRKRVILLAASGGGTRAALYTQSVLRGLHAQKALEDLVLASGVSGGGAALAYYAAHRDTLMADEGGRAWQRFSCDMSYPFIWDVLEGAAEWRIVAKTRLGQLLKESFDRVFYRQREGLIPPPRRTIGQAGLGLILNTSLAGHLDCPTCRQSREDFATLTAQKEVKRHTDGTVAGGRLIFTNLEDVSGFCQDNTSLNIPYIVIRDGAVELTTAAALNANFPPVFSNAPVDVNRRHRYWVTDGGATENRGLISLLLALRASLRKAPASLPNVPDIHIVMADASAGSTRYSQDRGIGSKFGAPTKLANKLIRELLDDIIRLYAQREGKVYYHDLTMPDFLRVNGGLGTHWMLPRAVKMQTHSGTSSLAEPASLELDTLTIRQVINDLHRPKAVNLDQACQIGLCPDDELSWQWSQEERRAGVAKILEQLNVADGPHRQAWRQLIDAWPNPGTDSR